MDVPFTVACELATPTLSDAASVMVTLPPSAIWDVSVVTLTTGGSSSYRLAVMVIGGSGCEALPPLPSDTVTVAL